MVLCLGTGTEDGPKAPHFRHVFDDGFIPRLCRSFMSSLDGERVWHGLLNPLDEDAKADYFRLNIPLRGSEPRLDDVKQMEDLREYVQLQPSGHEDRIQIASALITTSFFFELERKPIINHDHFSCLGVNDIVLGAVSTQDICKRCHLYRKKITFSVRHLEDQMTMYVNLGAASKQRISGFPHSMLWFIDQQRFDGEFERDDHDASTRQGCRSCALTLGMACGRKRNFSTSLSPADKRVQAT